MNRRNFFGRLAGLVAGGVVMGGEVLPPHPKVLLLPEDTNQFWRSQADNPGSGQVTYDQMQEILKLYQENLVENYRLRP